VPLVDHRDSVLVVVDAQEAFYAGSLPRAERDGAERALARMTWLARLAALLEIPIVLTEEEPERNGAAFAPLAEVAGSAAQVKPTFGLAGTPEILASIEATQRRTTVLAGFETDVCVAQSAIGLKERDLRVVVVEDAVFSPGEMHARGLARIAGAGVELNHCKGLAYEWTRTVDESRRVLGASELGEPPFRL
jgi:nicotinamidase-related amidase